MKLKINGHVSPETLDILETQWLIATDKSQGTVPYEVRKCVSDTHEENREKMANCLHPDREPCHIYVHEYRAGPEDATVAITGNGPLSENNAAFITNALIFMPELIRTCRAALKHDCPAPDETAVPIMAHTPKTP